MRLIDADKLIEAFKDPYLCNVAPRHLEIMEEKPTVFDTQAAIDGIEAARRFAHAVLSGKKNIDGDLAYEEICTYLDEEIGAIKSD